jgi:hypothetical protein
VAVSGAYAYVADLESGLQVIEITNPESPQIVGGVETNYAWGVAVSGTHAYIADGYVGIKVIDIADPASPRIVSSLDTGFAVSVAVSGFFACVACYDWLRVVDITDPEHPRIVGTVETPGQEKHVAVSGTRAYVADDSWGLHVIDITDPTHPAIVGTVNTPGRANAVAVSGSYAYVADENSGLQVIDITDPENPSIVGSVVTPRYARGAVVMGSHAYITDSIAGLLILPSQCGPSSNVERESDRQARLNVHPNPGRGPALIGLETGGEGRVLVNLYDVAGRHVRTLYDGILPAGTRDLRWNGLDSGGRPAPAGAYWVRVESIDGTSTQKLVVLP